MHQHWTARCQTQNIPGKFIHQQQTIQAANESHLQTVPGTINCTTTANWCANPSTICPLFIPFPDHRTTLICYWGWHALMMPLHPSPITEPHAPAQPRPSPLPLPCNAPNLLPNPYLSSAWSSCCCWSNQCHFLISPNNPVHPQPIVPTQQSLPQSSNQESPDHHIMPPIHQTILLSDPQNEPWGDEITKDIPAHIFCVLSCNVNTINLGQDFLEWQAVAYALHDYLVGVVCLQETNMQRTLPLLNCVRQIFCNLPSTSAAIAASNSKDVTLGNYQPRGACTIAPGKWTSRTRFTEQDPHRLKHWSYIEFEGCGAQRIIIASGYRLCPQPTQLGSSTFHNQQYHLLLAAGVPQPNPWLQFLDDIIHSVRKWHHQQKAVLLCMDANNDVTQLNPKRGLGHLLAETDLINLHHQCFPILSAHLPTTEGN